MAGAIVFSEDSVRPSCWQQLGLGVWFLSPQRPLGLSLLLPRYLPVNLVLEALGVWRGVQEGKLQQEPSKAATHRGKHQCDKHSKELIHGLRCSTALTLGYEWEHSLQAISISLVGGQCSHQDSQDGPQ